MNILRSLFSFSPLCCFMEHNLLFSPRSLPQPLIQYVSTLKGRQEFQIYLRSSQTVQKQIKVTGLLALLFCKSSEFYCIVEQSLEVKPQTADWLKSKIIIPFKIVLKKCSETFEQFQATKRRQFKKQNSIKRLVYLIHLLKQCCLIGLQLPRLGRYFLSQIDANNQLYQFIGETYMFFLSQLYSSFKFNLSNYLRTLSKQLDLTEFQENESILKWMMMEVVPQLNQMIQDINSNKYFMFVENGYKIDVFDGASQSSAVQKFINLRLLTPSGQNKTIQRMHKQKMILQYEKEISASLPNSRQMNRKFSQNSTGCSNKSSPTEGLNPEIYQLDQE